MEPLSNSPPAPPLGVPSRLLERRPDIAAAERRVAEANARIGIAKAAYYPNVTLSASGGFESAATSSLLNWSSRVWSVGSGLAQSVFDAGLRRATVQQFRAAYDNTVATYRQTVLTAFQQVEDDLVSLKTLARQIEQQEAAVKASERYLNLATVRYKTGVDSYLNVITAQTTLLVNRQTLVTLRSQEMTANVQLVQAVGGGWDVSQMPSPKQVLSKTTR
jgi:NodT family efflux transporter outer membrane factor (OMF) lipoprotein